MIKLETAKRLINWKRAKIRSGELMELEMAKESHWEQFHRD